MAEAGGSAGWLGSAGGSAHGQQFPAQGTAWTQTGRRGNLGQPTENKDESQFLLSDPLPWEDADVYEGQLGATLYLQAICGVRELLSEVDSDFWIAG